MTPVHDFFEIERIPEKRIAIVHLNRPERRNAMNWPFWAGLPAVVDDLEGDSRVRAVVVAGRGKSFTIGLDIEEFAAQFHDMLHSATGDGRENLLKLIRQMQLGLLRILDSRLVFIAAVHRHCIGGGLDLISACDLRVAASDAVVSLRETRVGIVADMGSLNLLPFIIGQGNTRRMAFTGGDFGAAECLRMGLFDEVLEDRDTMMDRAVQLAGEIAANPAIVLRGVKGVLNAMYSLTPREGFEHVALWNAAMLDSRDFREFLSAFAEKRRPNFDP